MAVAIMQGNPGQVAGKLYEVDLVGDCLGVLLGAVIFIPVLGIPQTCAVIVLVGVARLVILI